MYKITEESLKELAEFSNKIQAKYVGKTPDILFYEIKLLRRNVAPEAIIDSLQELIKSKIEYIERLDKYCFCIQDGENKLVLWFNKEETTP